MESIAWMAWTLPTAIFFALLACTLAVMTCLAVAYPEAERVAILRIPTTRGDRLFVSLILAAVIHLLWIASSGPNRSRGCRSVRTDSIFRASGSQPRFRLGSPC